MEMVGKLTRSRAKIIGECGGGSSSNYNSDSSDTNKLEGKVKMKTRSSPRGKEVDKDNGRKSGQSDSSVSSTVGEEKEETVPKNKTTLRTKEVVVMVERVEVKTMVNSKNNVETLEDKKKEETVSPLANGEVDGKEEDEKENGIEDDVDVIVETSKNNGKNDSDQLIRCSCENKLKELEGEVKDLKTWKASRQQLDDIIFSWKEEMDKWMLSKFGFTVSLSSSEGVGGRQRNTARMSSEVVTVPSTTKRQAQTFIDEGDVLENSPQTQGHNINRRTSTSTPAQVEKPVATTTHLNSREIENVEITPEVFGHFLLGNDPMDEWHPGEEDEEHMDIDNAGEDDDDTVQPENTRTEVIKQFMDGDADDDSDDSDECYVMSAEESNSDDDDSDSDFEVEYTSKKGKGRGGGRMTTEAHRQNSKPPTQSKSSSTSSSTKKQALDIETRKELMKQCLPRGGNLWECKICGFMLASFENMLLHIKYNHSTTAHTCPYCRVIVLCRSAKDALVHEETCRLRPSSSNNIARPVQYSSVPVPVPIKLNPATVVKSSSSSQMSAVAVASASLTAAIAKSRNRVAVAAPPQKKSRVEMNAEIKQLVEDILRPNSSTAAKYLTKLKQQRKQGLQQKKKTDAPPTVVTLSSDEEDDDEDGSSDSESEID